MRKPLLSIDYIERALSEGGAERLEFEGGVNLLIGVPNTGKTKWMETLDYVLGDPDENPFAGESEDMLADKYESMSAGVSFGDDVVHRVDRRWRQPNAKSKVFVDDDSMSTKEFQHWLMKKLNVPLLHYPKGNPMSGQTWPELSFRSMYRHMYRRQQFWADLVDKQPEAERLACIQNFLGVADQIYTQEYGDLVDLKRQIERLEARRDQYSDTLNDLARELLDDDGLTVSVTTTSIAKARERNQEILLDLQEKRAAALAEAKSSVIQEQDKSHVDALVEERADLVHLLEQNRESLNNTQAQITAISQLRSTLLDEIDRVHRASDAADVLSDLKITHCPSCDQKVRNASVSLNNCGLCHQSVSEPLLTAETGKERIKFESERLKAEVKETDELVGVANDEAERIVTDIRKYIERLSRIEVQLKPARALIGGLVQEDVSNIDLEIGQLNERNIQLDRVESVVDVDVALNAKIGTLKEKLEPLEESVAESREVANFDECASWLEDGMNEYLNAVNALRPDSWKHSSLGVYLSKSTFTLRIGNKRWKRMLGGTDTLFVLMAYQYGLLSLIRHDRSNFPGLIIIDTPAEFIGEKLGDGLNFIVQPRVRRGWASYSNWCIL